MVGATCTVTMPVIDLVAAMETMALGAATGLIERHIVSTEDKGQQC